MAYINNFWKLISPECKGLQEISKKNKTSEGGGEDDDKQN